ncbi:MAG: 23S rRNA (uracil(1939)-C(5))-methyltransferase RlmD [Flavobacteriales bacterium]|nr:23S rRNA (uracil(1939)-C(5))-methyltransferase RlmD [Flavobacteriales bacterium]
MQSITIERAGAEGNCIAHWNGKVVFVKKAVPGDVCDLKIVGKKKKFLIAEIEIIHQTGSTRTTPFCNHFGVCGGCKWQQMSYESQLDFKTQQVKDAFERIGKLPFENIPKALGSRRTEFYRNKMEYTFSHSRWLERELIEANEFVENPGLGFHIPQRFDKIVHIDKCWLQHDLANQIRNWCYDYSIKNNFEFYNARTKEGFVRNLMLRNNRRNEWMVLLTFGYESDEIKPMLSALKMEFTEIISLVYAINEKVNDSLYDLDIQTFDGEEYLKETLNDLNFKIRPKSFFQTNPEQAEILYETALEFADLKGHENVYDLYCGTGTISLFLAKKARKVVGIESVPQAIADANENAKDNKIDNCQFVVGDMKDELNDDFTTKYGKPDVIITDPPRAGMHQAVVEQILKLEAPRVVYVSCNPATQARDLDLMREKYRIIKVQPVDMFPHTHHVENVVLLELTGSLESSDLNKP